MAIQHIDQPNILNPIYYWNNFYNPNLVRHRMWYEMERSYFNLHNNMKPLSSHICIPLNEFKKDNIFNYKNHLPMNTYHYTLKIPIFSYYGKKIFYKKYDHTRPITVKDIWVDEETFGFRIDPSLSGLNYLWLFMNTKFLIFPNHTEILICGDERIITEGIFEELLENPESEMLLQFESRGSWFHKKALKKEVKKHSFDIHEMDSYHMIGNQDDPNRLRTIKMVMQYSAETKYDGLYLQCWINQSPETNKIKIFYPDEEGKILDTNFKNSDYIDMWSFSEPNTSWLSIEGLTPGIELSIKCAEYNDYGQSSYNENCIALYEYADTGLTQHNSFIKRFVPINAKAKYPNILSFSVEKKGNYHIHKNIPPIISKSWKNAKMIWLYSPLFPFYNYCQNKPQCTDNNHECVSKNEWIKNAESFLNGIYQPLEEWAYDYPDYQKHDFYGDVRGYDTKKWYELLKDNPATMIMYTRTQHTITRVQKTMSASSNTSKIINGRIQSDTLFYMKDKDYAISLGECCYVAFSTSDDISHNNELFIDGLRTLSHYEESMNRVYRIFFRPDQVTENSEITITTCKHPLLHKIEADLEFSQKGDIVPFPDPEQFGPISIGDTMVIDKITGEYVNPNNFDYTVNVDNEYVDNPYNDQYIDHGVNDLMRLLTHSLEYYNTVHDQHIILNDPHSLIPNPPSMDKSQSNKVINPEEIRIECKNEMDVNREMIITNTTNGKWGQILDCSNKHHNHKIIFSNWKEDPSPNRFRAYHNGYLLMDTDYDYIPPTKYGGEAIFDFSKFTEGHIILDYMPYREIRIYDGPLSELKGMISVNNCIYRFQHTARNNDDFGKNVNWGYWTDGWRGIIFDTSQYCNYPVAAQMVKIWIDGRLLNPARITDTRALGYVAIDMRGYEDINGNIPSRITIYIDRIDDDCFEYQNLLKSDPIRALVNTLSTENNSGWKDGYNMANFTDFLAVCPPDYNSGDKNYILHIDESDQEENYFPPLYRWIEIHREVNNQYSDDYLEAVPEKLTEDYLKIGTK